MSAPFVHLHVHSHYSLLDGATRIEPVVERAKSLGMPALAITDHGNMFGAVEFYSAAKRAGIKPIIGCETYLTPGDRRDKESGRTKEAFHQLLLAMNLEGYQNLMRLVTMGFTEGFYRRPRIDKQILREYSGGLLCTSTCLSGEVPHTLLTRDRKEAEERAKEYLEIFGPDRFFIELQNQNLPEQKTINPELVDMANRLGVAVIATNDVHYLDHTDSEAHDVLCCINTASLVSQEDRFKFPNDQFYFKTPDEMAALFPDHPEALENTLRVAEMCNLELKLNERHAPVFRVPDEIADESGAKLTDADYLRRLVHEGAKERYGEISKELAERIEYELEVITSKGFASYILIVWDCVNFARQHGIPIGARGSACSAVITYCLGISTPDPIRYGLYFERFMDPDRDEMPDIDLDICQDGRGAVIDYVRNKYGHVAQIITFGTLKAKAAIKDVARVLGMGFEEANELTKLVPNELKMTIEKALNQEPELRKRYEVAPQVRRVVDLARSLEGVVRNAGVHAAGVVVADQPLVQFLPLYRAAGQDTVVTQFDGPTVEKVGLLKMDFLGLRTLSILERARQLAERSTGDSIDLTQIVLDDLQVYDLFARGDTKGIFQFESGGMRDVLLRMKPNRIEDLIAANALYRPGPMQYITDYVARKHGQKWDTPHPLMSEILAETYGVMVYQEQVSRIVNRLGNIELKKAFRLAKAISKKNTSMIEEMRNPFLEGCAGNHLRRQVAERVFEDILKFGGYAFNKAHSTGYALVAYQTAWMKTYHPMEFMAALMTYEMSSADKVAEYREECREMRIVMAPPDINASEYDFVVEKGHPSDQSGETRTARTEQTGGNGSASNHAAKRPAGSTSSPVDSTVTSGSEATGRTASGMGMNPGGCIRFGLGAIKGLGAKAVQAIVDERERNGPFKSLFDFSERVDLTMLNRSAIQALICAGAFDSTGGMRKALFNMVDNALSAGQQLQRDLRNGQITMFGDFQPQVEQAATVSPPSSVSSTSRTSPVSTALTDEWTESEMLMREKSVLGFYITKHPLTRYETLLTACSSVTTVDLAKRSDGSSVVIGGMISSLRTVFTKRGRGENRRMGILTVEDLKGRVEAVVLPDDLVIYRTLLAPDKIVFLEGTVDRKREDPSIRVSRVVPVDDALSQFSTALLLTLRKENTIPDLVKLLKASSGSCPVYVNVPTSEGTQVQIECSPSLRVHCEPKFLKDLIDLLGLDAVYLLGACSRSIPPKTWNRADELTSVGSGLS